MSNRLILAAIFNLFCLRLAAVDGVRLDSGFNPLLSDRRSVVTFTALLPNGQILVNEGTQRLNSDGSIVSGVSGIAANSVVNAVATPNHILLQTNSGQLIVAGTDGTPIASVNGVDPSSIPLLALPTGKFLVGRGLSIGGVTRLGITRLNTDGTIDPTFDAGNAPATPSSLSIRPDGKIVVSGHFSSFDGFSTVNVVRLNTNGTVDRTFAASASPAGTSIINPAVALADGKILACEWTTTRHLIRFNADGTVDATLADLWVGSQPYGNVYAFAQQPDGRILVAGQFDRYGNATRRNLFRLNTDGSLDTSFDANDSFDLPASIIYRFALQSDGKILCNDGRTTNQGYLVRLNTDGSLDSTFLPGADRRPASIVAARYADGRIVVAGSFTSVNGATRFGIARLQADGTSDPSFVAPASVPLDISALATQSDGAVIVVGPFTAVAGQPRPGIARFSASGSLDPSLNPTLNDRATVSAVTVLADGHIVIGGTFTSVNGVARTNLAAFRADGSLDADFAAGLAFNGAVTLLAPRMGGGVFAAGAFTTAGDERRNHLAALTTAGAVDTVFAPAQLNTTDNVTAFAPAPDGGVFIATPKTVTGLPRAWVRRLKADGTTDAAFAFPLDINATFTALAADSQGRVVAAYNSIEQYDNYNFNVHSLLQRFSASGAIDRTFNVGIGPPQSYPTAVLESTGSQIVSSAVAAVTGPTAPISTLTIGNDGGILAGGTFVTFDDLPVANAVLLRPDGPASPATSALLNISTRGRTGATAGDLIAGFVIAGTTPKSVLLRAVGPGLSAYGVASPNANPALALANASGTFIRLNNDWAREPGSWWSGVQELGFYVAESASRAGAFSLQSADAAFVVTLNPGIYTAVVKRGDWAEQSPLSGICLVEVYDLNTQTGDRRITNISTRGFVGPGEDTLIAGFVVGGGTSKNLLVRAAGPALATYSVPSYLIDPNLTVKNAAGAVVASNNDWGSGADAAAISTAAVGSGAFAFANGSKDAALLLTLAPGIYTALVSGAGDSTGTALVEVYELP